MWFSCQQSFYPLRPGSREDFVNHLSVHVGEAHGAAAEAEGGAAVVETEEVEHRGVQVVSPRMGADGHSGRGSPTADRPKADDRSS